MPERDLLMIPGPIDVDPPVLRALSRPPLAHTSPEFIEIFGSTITALRDVFLAPQGQPFVVAGSGTLAMEMGVANLLEPGDKALVINTGFFSERYADVCKRFGATVETLNAPLGDAPAPDAADKILSQGGYKLMTITQVDTSTGVLADVRGLAEVARKHNVLVVVDGVCATAAEEFRQDEWGVDVCITGSQKALSVPPGIAFVMAGPRAIAAFEARKTPVASYYSDWGLWKPVMQAYEQRKPAYFATPPVNLIFALQVAVQQILAEGMPARWERHRRLSNAFKSGIDALGLRQVPLSPVIAAHTMSAVYYPEGVNASVLGKIKAEGVVLAGGIAPAIRDRYFRIGHMGNANASDILAALGAIERGLAAAGARVDLGAGVAAAQRSLAQTPATV